MAKVKWHPGDLYPRVGFIVTDLSWPTLALILMRLLRVALSDQCSTFFYGSNVAF